MGTDADSMHTNIKTETTRACFTIETTIPLPPEVETTPETATAAAPLAMIPSSLPLSALIARIKRRRKGGKRQDALRLREQLQRLANRRWARCVKGKGRPSPNQAVAIIDTIREALDHVHRDSASCSNRTTLS